MDINEDQLHNDVLKYIYSFFFSERADEMLLKEVNFLMFTSVNGRWNSVKSHELKYKHR